MKPTLLALSVWAPQVGRSYERAKTICHQGRVPGAIPYVSHLDGKISFLVPEGTPWPTAPVEEPPEGYITLRAWAVQVKKSVRTVRLHLYKVGIPEARQYGSYGYNCVPDGLPWPKQSRKPRAASDAHPAREAA